MSARAKNIVQRLKDLGAIVPGTSIGNLIQEVDRMICDDYIPGGKAATHATNLRTASAGYRCGMPIGNDVQSGPIYCGDPATMIGDCDNGKIVCVCTQHESALKRIAK